MEQNNSCANKDYEPTEPRDTSYSIDCAHIPLQINWKGCVLLLLLMRIDTLFRVYQIHKPHGAVKKSQTLIFRGFL